MPDPDGLTEARSLEQLEADALFVLRDQGHAGSTVQVAFAPMAAMRAMKKEYLGKDQEVVDVLAFPADPAFPDASGDASSLGDIYLNFDAFGDDLARLRFLLVHGVLHLLGYRHDEPSDIIVMEKLEETLCRRIASQDSTSDPTS